MALSELARALEMAPSTCFNLVRTFEARGFLYATGQRRALYPTKRMLILARDIAQHDPIGTPRRSHSQGHRMYWLISAGPLDKLKRSSRNGAKVLPVIGEAQLVRAAWLWQMPKSFVQEDKAGSLGTTDVLPDLFQVLAMERDGDRRRVGRHAIGVLLSVPGDRSAVRYRCPIPPRPFDGVMSR